MLTELSYSDTQLRPDGSEQDVRQKERPVECKKNTHKLVTLAKTVALREPYWYGRTWHPSSPAESISGEQCRATGRVCKYCTPRDEVRTLK